MPGCGPHRRVGRRTAQRHGPTVGVAWDVPDMKVVALLHEPPVGGGCEEVIVLHPENAGCAQQSCLTNLEVCLGPFLQYSFQGTGPRQRPNSAPTACDLAVALG